MDTMMTNPVEEGMNYEVTSDFTKMAMAEPAAEAYQTASYTPAFTAGQVAGGVFVGVIIGGLLTAGGIWLYNKLKK